MHQRTYEQILMDWVEASGYKEDSVVEIVAKRLRHSIDTALRHQRARRTRRAQDTAREASETPLVRFEGR